ncbi:MAG: endonuclease III domain-containing protein [Candidatus Micrarchaeia archaeon]
MTFKLLDAASARKVLSMLKAEYPNAKYYLNFKTPIDLLVAAIISAQTRDDVVNAITPALFEKFRSASDYANASPEELLKYINKVSFAGKKAENIIAACKAIVRQHSGKVPANMDDLLALPGVGRKTANTILINAYGIVEGIPVDTWVLKLSYRIGLSSSTKPEEVEADLMKIVDKKDWHNISYILKAHGKKVCQSTVPICSSCIIKGICPKNGVSKSR